MLVVLASRHDAGARALVEEWASSDARLLTCEDLTTAGWFCHLADPSGDIAVIGGQRVPVECISAVLIRLGWVGEAELPHIDAPDRTYVAAELAAFLTFWLSELKSPVLNRPTAGSLNGPAWRPEQWNDAARRVGMTVASEPRRFVLGSAPQKRQVPETAIKLVVVQDRCLGDAHDEQKARAVSLAKAAGAGLLGVSLSGPDRDARFLHATPYPDLERADVRKTLLKSLS
jgi:hypothetical protein